MDKRSRRRFTKEFKTETVALARNSGKAIAEMCRDMGLAESTVHRWMTQDEIDGGQRDGLTSTEREELSRIRREILVLVAWAVRAALLFAAGELVQGRRRHTAEVISA